LIIVVTVFLAVVLMYSSSHTSNVFVRGRPVSGGHIDCDYASSNDRFFKIMTCCWWEQGPGYAHYVCQACSEDGSWCGPIKDTDTRKSPINAPPPPPGPGKGGPGNVLPEGVFEQPEKAPSPGGSKGLKPLIPPITTEEAPQAAPAPTCTTGQELDEDTNLCVPVPQEQEEQQQQESEDEGDDSSSSEDDGNNSDENN
jgi:hypothetical protein